VYAYNSKWDTGHIAQQTGSYAYQRALVALRMEYDLAALLLACSIASLYGVVFATTLLMSAFDVLASVRNGYPATDQWPELALQDTDFAASLNRWKALNNLRVICSVGAWLGSCLFVWKDLTQLNSKSADLFRLRETTVAWSSRVAQMQVRPHIHTYIHIYTYIHTLTYIHLHTYIHTYIHLHTYIHTYIHTHTHIHTLTYTHTPKGGAGMEKLRPAALRKLVAILKIGSERAKDALSFYDHEQEAAEGAVAVA
jgi:hypothetical protein